MGRGGLIAPITVLVRRTVVLCAQDMDVAASGGLVLVAAPVSLGMQARTARQSAMGESTPHAWGTGSAMMGPKGMAAASVTMNGEVQIVQNSVLGSQPKVKSVVHRAIAPLMHSVSARTTILAILQGWPAKYVKTTGLETRARTGAPEGLVGKSVPGTEDANPRPTFVSALCLLFLVSGQMISVTDALQDIGVRTARNRVLEVHANLVTYTAIAAWAQPVMGHARATGLRRLATGQVRIAVRACLRRMVQCAAISVSRVGPMVSVAMGSLAPACVSVPPPMGHGLEGTVTGALQDTGVPAVKWNAQVFRPRSAQATVHVSMD